MPVRIVQSTAKVLPSTHKKNKVIQRIAEKSGLSQKAVTEVFSALLQVIGDEINDPSVGECRIPCVGIKLRRIVKPAAKAREMLSPLTGKTVLIPAKPARRLIKLIALKPLKDLLTT